MPPGDNYRVTACANVDTLAAMTWAQANAGGAPKYGQTTELLTVWRKLHVECDSMGAPGGPPPPQDLFGTLTGVNDYLYDQILFDHDANWLPFMQLVGSEVDPNIADGENEAFVVTETANRRVISRCRRILMRPRPSTRSFRVGGATFLLCVVSAICLRKPKVTFCASSNCWGCGWAGCRSARTGRRPLGATAYPPGRALRRPNERLVYRGATQGSLDCASI